MRSADLILQRNGGKLNQVLEPLADKTWESGRSCACVLHVLFVLDTLSNVYAGSGP